MSKLNELIAEADELTKAAREARIKLDKLKTLTFSRGQHALILSGGLSMTFQLSGKSLTIEMVLKTADWLRSLGFTLEEQGEEKTADVTDTNDEPQLKISCCSCGAVVFYRRTWPPSAGRIDVVPCGCAGR